MKQTLLLFSITIFVILTCEKNRGIVSPGSPEKIAPGKLRQLVDITMTDYDSVLIASHSGNHFDNKPFSGIELGEKDVDGFHGIKQVMPVYVEKQTGYELSFSIPQEILNKSLREYFFSLRFFLEEGGFVDLDTMVLTYKYPYPSTQIFIDNLEAFHEYPYLNRVQDFVLIGRKLYSYCFGPVTVSEYDLDTRKVRELYYFPGGDHIAGNMDYLFLDDEHYRIFRHNFKTDTLDLEIKYPYSRFFPSPRGLWGLEVFENCLYVGSVDTTGGSILLKYDLDGNFIDFLPTYYSGYCLSIKDGLLYTNWYDLIAQIDLTSGTLLSEILSPANVGDGIRAYADKLYFTDYNRRLISTIPLAEFDSARISGLQKISQKMPSNYHVNMRDQNDEVLKP